jgi:hypothetical protein
MLKKKLLSILTALVMTSSLTLPVFADQISGDADTLSNNFDNSISLTVDSGAAWSIINCGVTVLKSNGSKSVNMDNGVSGTISTEAGLTLSKNQWSISNYGEYDNFTVRGTAPDNYGTENMNLGTYKVYLTCTSEDDLGGLSKAYDFININIIVRPAVVKTPSDVTAPIVTATPDRAANEYGWYNDDVTVSFRASDEESGIISVDEPKTVRTEGKDQVISGEAVNGAGMTGMGSATISIDKTKPTIIGSIDKTANAAGWYNEDVTVSFVSQDTLSGIASEESPKTLTEGANQSVTGTATDYAGNSASYTVPGINIDKTVPKVKFGDAPVFLLNHAQPSIQWEADDSLSGIEESLTEVSTIDTSSVGTKTFSVKVFDKAGNFETYSINYKVVYNFGGILQPINSNGLSVFKAGSTVPVKFQLTDANGAFVTNAVATIKYAKFANNVWGDEIEAVSTAAATTGNLFRYDTTNNQYIFNLSTKGLTTGTYKVTISLSDGTAQTVEFGLK